MRPNHVLIDFESLRPDGLDLLAAEHFRVMVFVGAQQHRIPFAFVQAMQRLGARGEYIKLSGSGPNALDFHIAFHMGRLSQLQPDAFFHVISHDTGFDPLIAHLKERGLFAGRWAAITDIPHVRAGLCTTVDERLAVVLAPLGAPFGIAAASKEDLEHHHQQPLSQPPGSRGAARAARRARGAPAHRVHRRCRDLRHTPARRSRLGIRAMSGGTPALPTALASGLPARMLKPIELKPAAALVSLAFFVGGLTVLLFFWRVGFMPDADLASTTGIFFAAALVGFWSIIGSLLVGMLHGVVTTYLLQARRLPAHAALIAVAPVLAFLFAAAIVIRREIEPDWLGPWHPALWVVAAFAVGVAGAAVAAWQRRQFRGPIAPVRWPWAQDALAFAMSALVWLMGTFQVLALAGGLAGENGHTAVWSIALGLLWVALLVAINVMAATLPWMVSGLYVFLNVLPLLLLLTVLAGGPSALASYVLRQLGLAEIAHVDLVLEPAACRALAAAPTSGLRCEAAGNVEGSAVLDVRVRSRIGSQVLVERQTEVASATSPAVAKGRPGSPQVVLRKSDIVLWVRR